MSLDMSEKFQLVPVRIPSLFELNVLKTVGRTQIEGSCKVYAGKTHLKSLENKLKAVPLKASSEEHVKHSRITLADDSYSGSIYLFQSM